MGVIVTSLATDRCVGENISYTWVQLGAAATGLGVPATRLGARQRSLGAPATILGAPATALGARATTLGAARITVEQSGKNISSRNGAAGPGNHSYYSSFNEF